MSLQNRFYYPFDTRRKRRKKNSLKMLKEKELETFQSQNL